MQAKKSSKNQLPIDIRFRIKTELARKGITQRTLAKSVGVTPQAVTNWLTGKSGMERAQMIKVSESLGQSMDFLFRSESNQSKQSSSDLILRSSQTPYPSDSRRVILNPDFEPSKEMRFSEKVKRHLDPWIEEAEKSEDVAAHIYTQLKLHLPLSHIERLKEDDGE